MLLFRSMDATKVLVRFIRQAAGYELLEFWTQDRKRIKFRLAKGQLELETDDGEPDLEIVFNWTTRFAATVVAIIPVELRQKLIMLKSYGTLKRLFLLPNCVAISETAVIVLH